MNPVVLPKLDHVSGTVKTFPEVELVMVAVMPALLPKSLEPSSKPVIVPEVVPPVPVGEPNSFEKDQLKVSALAEEEPKTTEALSIR